MASLLFRGKKGVNISCTSPASTATCTSVDHRRSVISGHSGARALDRRTPHLSDARRARVLNSVPQSPSKPKSNLQKSRRSMEKRPTDLISPAGSSRYLLNDDDSLFDVFPDLDPLPALIQIDSARFHSVSLGDDSAVLKPSSSARSQDPFYFRAPASSSSSSSSLSSTRVQDSAAVTSSSSTRSQDRVYFRASSSPPSTRFQTTKGDESAAGLKASSFVKSQDRAFFRASSSLSETRFQTVKQRDESAVLKPSSSARSRDQVVALRVSLHCKGCEGKVRKHLSRMEGVTSFNIDFATKKVTVVGDVTPLGVLSSISKVKNAQFWPSPPRSSSSSSSSP